MCSISLSGKYFSQSFRTYYQLLQAVNIAHLFPDDKTFVDKVVMFLEFAVTGMITMT